MEIELFRDSALHEVSAMKPHTLSRRSFLTFSAMLPWALSARAAKSIPVGLELYSVRNELKKDPEGTVRAVAQMGYQGVEFYAPYFEWSEIQTKQMRKLLDDLGIRCFSTHNDSAYLSAEKIGRARDMNLILAANTSSWLRRIPNLAWMAGRRLPMR